MIDEVMEMARMAWVNYPEFAQVSDIRLVPIDAGEFVWDVDALQIGSNAENEGEPARFYILEDEETAEWWPVAIVRLDMEDLESTTVWHDDLSTEEELLEALWDTGATIGLI